MLKEKLADQFDFLKAKTPPLIGCDISSSSVKMVEIAEAGRNRQLKQAVHMALAAESGSAEFGHRIRTWLAQIGRS